MLEILSFFEETEPKILKIIGGTSDIEYNYLLKELDKKCREQKNCILFNENIQMPFNDELIISLSSEVKKMDLNHLEKEEIILTNDERLNIKIKNAVVSVLSPVLLHKNFKSQVIKENFFIKQIAWLYEYINKFDWFCNDIPFCIYYGAISDEESYLLRMLNIIGSKLLYICSISDTELLQGDTLTYNVLPLVNLLSRIANAPERLSNLEASESNVVTTWAKEARNELDTCLYGDCVFRPWSFRTGNTVPLYIDAVLEDIETYWEQDARFRPGFKVKNKLVYVPNFIVKINGVYSDIAKYNELVNKTISTKFTLLMKESSLVCSELPNQDIYSLAFVIENDVLNFEKIKNHNLYKLNNINIDTQNFILLKLNNFINMYKSKVDIKELLALIGVVITMPSKYLSLIENFDFPFKIPKLIIYLSGSQSFDILNGLFLNFLNLIGLDILIYSPSNTPSLEYHMYDNHLSIIELEENINDLTFEKLTNCKNNNKSFLRKLFNI